MDMKKEYEKPVWKAIHTGKDGHYTTLELSTTGFLKIATGKSGDKTIRSTITIKLSDEEQLIFGEILRNLALRTLLP